MTDYFTTRSPCHDLQRDRKHTSMNRPSARLRAILDRFLTQPLTSASNLTYAAMFLPASPILLAMSITAEGALHSILLLMLALMALRGGIKHLISAYRKESRLAHNRHLQALNRLHTLSVPPVSASGSLAGQREIHPAARCA